MTPPPVILRFSATERAFHWSIALPTLVLLLSGLFLRFGWLQALMVGYDRRVGLRLHLVAGVALLFGPLLVALLGNRRALAEAARTLLRMEREDRRFLRDLPRWLRNEPGAGGEVGRFNGGQKLNTLVSGLLLLAATATGLILWVSPPLPDAATGALPVLTAWLVTLHEATTYSCSRSWPGTSSWPWSTRGPVSPFGASSSGSWMRTGLAGTIRGGTGRWPGRRPENIPKRWLL